MAKITLNDKTIDISDEAQSILEVLEQSGITPNYQCREGLCGSCRCTLRAGKIRYKTQPFAMARNKDEIFICIATALGDIELLSV